MSANRDREEEIFDAARELAADERRAYLAQKCGPDTDLRQRIEGMLAADAAAGEFFKTHDAPSPTVILAGASLSLSIEKPGDRIGRYKLLQQIGEGGMGLVYMAEQEQPVRRLVALKIIKLGMDTRQVVARFEAERQALAMMNHPHIAKVFDAGATDSGRPYFVMELVRGIPITEYCDKNSLPTRQRLHLFILVCQAVQHAHQKGIIHRDLKPSNILVTLNDGVPWPMVIDFGIAKATHQRLTEKTLFTHFAQMIGTPAYMSPEQAEMNKLDVDTRTDIYALGVLLYELLTGTTPFTTKELLSLGYREMQRTIAEREPLHLSARLSTMANEERTVVAKNRSVEVTALAKLFRGDLDWIATKCLEKDRARRYETANALAADIRRHLDCEPVVARPPSRLYEFQKTVRRHKFGFAAATALILVLMLGVVVSTWQAVRATNAEKRSAAALDELRATAPAFAEQARALVAREHFAEAIEKLDYALRLRPDAAEFLVAKGDLLRCQLKLAEAAAIYREALRAQPGFARAGASAKLCDELLAAPLNAEGKLTGESLAKLHLVMQQQQRPAAELMPVARLLGEEKRLIVEYWLARLKDLPVSTGIPLEKRLTVRDDGRLALDLMLTKVHDLSPLAAAPLAALDVSQCQALTDLSPLRGIALIELNLSGTSVADLTPLSEMHTLEKLNAAGSKVSDLAGLGALRLNDLDLSGTRTFNISALRGMKLKKLSLRNTRVADLSPLAGMPLTFFDATTIPATDYTPLTGAPLEVCIIQNSPLRDLSFLQNSPVKELCLFGCNELRGYSVLAGLKRLDLLILPQSFRSLPAEEIAAISALRSHPTLKNIQTEYRSGGGWIINTTLSKDVFWQDWDREQSLVLALRAQGLQFSLNKLSTGTYRLAIQRQSLHDLSILKDAPISELVLNDCPFSDLAPIHELKLELLELSSDSVADLTPLRGMPLKKLYLSGPKISELSPLKGLPLRDLYLDGCENLTDVAALAEIRTLENVTVPMQTRNIEVLRQLTKLQRVGLKRDADGLPPSTVPDFWKDFAPDGWLARLRDSGLKIRMLNKLPDGTWEVDLGESAISDLSMLRGAPISMLGLGQTKVSDLTPLRGMPLKKLWLWDTKVTDLAPLQGMRLIDLNLVGTKVADISALRGMPLDSIRLNRCAELTDLSPLAGATTLTKITLPPHAKNFEFLRASPKLERLSFEEDPSNSYHPDKTAAEFWKDFASNPWISRLRGFKATTLRRLDDGTWEVNLHGTSISDLTILQGAPIGKLTIGNSDVSDLSPLRGMPLKELLLYGTSVSDLTPLKGMPFKYLNLKNTAVTNISVVRGMPLEDLRLAGCKGITDLSPLADSRQLRSITLPPNAKDFEFLRNFPKLERISFKENPRDNYNPDKTAAEFWQEYGAKKQ